MAIYYGDGSTSNGDSSFGGRVVKCVTSHKGGHTVHTGPTWSSNVGGLTSSISMADSNNKILILWNVSLSAAPNVYSGQVRLLRDGTVIGGGVKGQTQHVVGHNHYFTSYDSYSGYTLSNMGNGYCDSPGDTSSHTYSLQIRSGYNNFAVTVNRTYSNPTNDHIGTAVSFLTLFEIAHS